MNVALNQERSGTFQRPSYCFRSADTQHSDFDPPSRAQSRAAFVPSVVADDGKPTLSSLREDTVRTKNARSPESQVQG